MTPRHRGGVAKRHRIRWRLHGCHTDRNMVNSLSISET